MSGSAPASRFDVVVFDADDTLWKNEDYFRWAAAQFERLIAPFAGDASKLVETLHRVETGNVSLTGYGVMAYTLSMVQAAIAATDGRVPARTIDQLIEVGYEMLRHPVEVLPNVRDVLTDTAATHPCLLITKGDLGHQTDKLFRSGLADLFDRYEVVPEKDTATYRRVFSQWALDPNRVVMVGNSLRSDVLPIMELGGHGVHVPYHTTWSHEHVEDHPGKHTELTSLSEFPDWFRATTA